MLDFKNVNIFDEDLFGGLDKNLENQAYDYVKDTCHPKGVNKVIEFPLNVVQKLKIKKKTVTDNNSTLILNGVDIGPIACIDASIARETLLKEINGDPEAFKKISGFFASTTKDGQIVEVWF